MDTVSELLAIRVENPLVTVGFPAQSVNNKFWFIYCSAEHAVEQIVQFLEIWEAMILI